MQTQSLHQPEWIRPHREVNSIPRNGMHNELGDLAALVASDFRKVGKCVLGSESIQYERVDHADRRMPTPSVKSVSLKKPGKTRGIFQSGVAGDMASNVSQRLSEYPPM
jgi:hypothetical protein